MKITPRDLAALNFVAEVGAVRLDDVGRLLAHLGGRPTELGARTTRGIVDRWKRSGFTEHHRIYHGQPSIIVVTRRGARLTQQPVGLRVGLPAVAELGHDLTTAAVAVLYECNGRAWTGERLLSTTFAGNHRPDGITFHRDQRTAVEIELTPKSSKRYSTILPDLTAEFDRVDYWVTPETESTVRSASANFLVPTDQQRVHLVQIGGLAR